MSLQETSSVTWYNRTGGALGLSVLCFGSSYLVGSRAIFTGSLQQYALTGILLIVAVNRSMVALQHLRGIRHGQQH